MTLLIKATNAMKEFAGEPLFQQVELEVYAGERIAIYGHNGIGKTTLLRLLSGALDPGSVRLHPQASIGYFSQELRVLDDSVTLLDSMLALPAMTQTQARTILGCFLFSGEDVFKRIGDLSMGERCRLAFLKLYFSGANLLVLDEPTNYLDIDTRETIEQALLHFPGAMIIVSHDHFLIRKIATKLLWLGAERSPIPFIGTYDEYVDASKTSESSPEQLERANERRQLELTLLQLMSEGEWSTEDAPFQLQRIREMKLRLSSLQD